MRLGMLLLTDEDMGSNLAAASETVLPMLLCGLNYAHQSLAELRQTAVATESNKDRE